MNTSPHFLSAPMMRMGAGGSSWPNWHAWYVTSAGVATAVAGTLIVLALWSRVSWRQKVCLTSALVGAVLLLSSDVQRLSMTSYRCHMIEHLLVILVIAPVISSAVTVPMSRMYATGGFLAFTVLVPLYHLTSLGSWVMNQSGGHVVELASFLLVGVWFWTPVYGVRRVMGDQQRLTYTMLAVPVVATTGLVLWSSTASSLSSTGMRMAMVTIGDIHNGGLIMMVWGTAMMMGHVAGQALQAALRAHSLREPAGIRYSLR